MYCWCFLLLMQSLYNCYLDENCIMYISQHVEHQCVQVDGWAGRRAGRPSNHFLQAK